MTTLAGTPLRKLITENSVLAELVHFGSLQLFNSQATTYTCLLFLSKTKHKSFKFESVKSLESWRANSHDTVELSHESITESAWTFLSDGEQEIFDKIERECNQQLNDIADIFVGLQTSSDSIYILTPLQRQSGKVSFHDINGRLWEIEEEITRPAILDLPSFDSLAPIQPNKVILYPYTEVNGHQVPLDDNDLQDRFPKAFEYFQSFKPELESRSMQGSGPWFRYGRAQSLDKFTNAKLVIKNPSLKATVALDEDNTLFTGGGNGPYYGVRPKVEVPLRFVHALLNSIIFDRWVKARSSVFRGGYYSYGKQFIEQFPIFDLEQNKDAVLDIVEDWSALLSMAPPSGTPNAQDVYLRQREQIMTRVNQKLAAVYSIDLTLFDLGDNDD